MSLEVPFGDGHTMDIGPWVEPNAAIQGIVFEKVYTAEIDGEDYSVLRCIGVTRPEMEFAQEYGAPALFDRLREVGIYPHTAVARDSVV
jgi:Suppressor of fused protein (SUFU)